MNKILIIQDSPSVNAMLKLRLESGGFSVETVETGEEGVEKAKAGQHQLILLDYNLPPKLQRMWALMALSVSLLSRRNLSRR